MDKLLTEEVINRINIGDGLTNLELKHALRFYKDVSDRLQLLGSEFKLAWKDVNRTLECLEAFQRARNRA